LGESLKRPKGWALCSDAEQAFQEPALRNIFTLWHSHPPLKPDTCATDMSHAATLSS
jgi:hypothetical protein